MFAGGQFPLPVVITDNLLYLKNCCIEILVFAKGSVSDALSGCSAPVVCSRGSTLTVNVCPCMFMYVCECAPHNCCAVDLASAVLQLLVLRRLPALSGVYVCACVFFVFLLPCVSDFCYYF